MGNTYVTKHDFWLAWACFTLFISGCAFKEPTSPINATVDYFADNAMGNALAIIQHPAGIHANGVTYVSYQGPGVAPYVAAYHHDSNRWQGPFKAGDSDLKALIETKNKIDSHGKPTMLIDDLGYIHIFYGGHGAGTQFGHNPYGGGGVGRNKHAVSTRPFDITEWENIDNISVFGTYNQAIKMDNGDIYLFYRHGAHRSDWVYQKSTDHGRSFTPAVPFLKSKRRTDINADDSWYVWVSKGQGNQIVLSYDYHVCWLRGEGPQGLGHVTQRHDLYYMSMDADTESFTNIRGQSLPMPMTKEAADRLTLVTKTGDKWTFNGSAKLDSRAYPHLAINIGDNMGQNTGGPKQTYYFRWTGKNWTRGTAVNKSAVETNTPTRGDFSIKGQQAQFWLAYQEQNDGVIATFETQDQGTTFMKVKEHLRRSNATWSISALIENAHPDAQMLVAEKIAGERFHRVYLIGENGPVSRKVNTLK